MNSTAVKKGMLEYNVNAAVKAMVSEIKHKDDEGNMDT